MPNALVLFVRAVNKVNRTIGRIVMLGVFVMMGVLLYASFTKTFFIPPLWSLEVSQFLMVGYFILGGAYSLQMGAHVRMDLMYGSWRPRTQTWVDVFTVACLIFYLCLLLYGGISSTSYALQYGERSYSAWRPYMAPIKIIMCLGIVLTLLQSIAILITDVARLRGFEIHDGLTEDEREQ
jgi:TRAP-type mannitol/chloroaromatic compound transport system permease small subunit